MVYLILLLMTFLGALASVFLKKASSKLSIDTFFKNSQLYIGGILYGIAALLNVFVLHYLEYSKVLPITSITYVWTLYFSHLLFREPIGNKKIAGVGLIILGAIFISV